MSKYYITTSIAYINSTPHIGYLFELVSTDILARYHNLIGEETFFLTGVDEHGIKNQQAAETAGLPTQEYANKMSAHFKQLKEDFDLTNNFFIRTTDEGHKKFCQDAWQRLNEKGVLEKRSYSGLYCTGCEAFKTEREIVDGKCTIHEKPVDKIEEENYFLVLKPETKEKIKNWLANGVIEPASRNLEISNILDEFESVSVSRPKERLNWGIPVPGDETQIMYVWTDALLNYLSGIELSGRKIEDFWPANAQVIGKDIVKFHAIIWPTILLELGYDLPKKLLVHGFITVDGKKMSKSLGTVISPAELLEHYAPAGKFNIDVVKYLIMRQISFYDDGNFSWAEFDSIYNGELANGIGNLLARTIGLISKLPENKKDDVKAAIEAFNLSPNKEELNDRIATSLGENNFGAYLEEVNHLVKASDGYISTTKPWENSEKLDWAKFVDEVKLFDLAYLIQPIMPNVAKEIRDQLTSLESRPIFPRIK